MQKGDFFEVLRRAAERSMGDVIKHRDSLLAKGYRSPAFQFAQILKIHPELAGLDAEAATRRIDAVLEAKFPDCLAPWVALGLPDYDSCNVQCDPRTDFLDVWDKINTKFQPGAWVHEAARCAEEKPLDFGGNFSAADAKLERLLSICYYLGERASGEFFLGCRDAGDVLGVSHVTAAQLIRRAEKLRFLEAVGEYSEQDRARWRAKTWRFRWSLSSPLAFLDA
ncbi:MAG TPA: hypothetical protein VGX68_10880 [Thermoanaerobaculia bacterium]|nr:hypothetical protein [Thermoanaerobaculia bacterium]